MNKLSKVSTNLLLTILVANLLFISGNSLAGVEPVDLTIQSNSNSVLYNTSVSISGSVIPSHPAETVSINKQPYGESKQVVTRILSGDGLWQYSNVMKKNTTYRAFFNHDGITESSGLINVYVKPNVVLTVSKGSFYLGDSTTVKATVGPSRPGATVAIQRYDSGVWKDVKKGVLNSSSQISYIFKPSLAKQYIFRAKYFTDNTFVTNLSPKKTVTAMNPFLAVVYSNNVAQNSAQQSIYYTSRVNKAIQVISDEFSPYAYKKIYDADVANLTTLKKYKVVVFINMTCVSRGQRAAIRAYVKDGGKILASFGLARNDSDGTALITKYQFKNSWDLSRYWEWEELSEVYQLKFNNDPLMAENYQVNTGASTHPIVTRTKEQLNLSKLVLYSSRPDYNELVWKISNNSNITPIMFYSTKSNGTTADDSSHGFGAAWVSKYYKGICVYYNFMLQDFFWDTQRSAQAKNSVISKALFINTIKWLKETSSNATITKTTNPTASSWLSGNKDSGFILNVKHTVANTGNIQLRGEYFVEVYKSGVYTFSGRTVQVPLGTALSWTHNSWHFNVGSPSTTTYFGVKVGSYYFDGVRGGVVKAHRYYTYKYVPGKLPQLYLISMGSVIIG